MTSDNIGWDPLRVELLWDLKEKPRRGPKPTLTVAEIAQKGIDIADAYGLAAVSMQRIAEELGVGTMSLYTYVPDKDALLEVMLDMAFKDTAPDSDSGGWRANLEQGATRILAAYQKHPWALQIFVGGPPLGPSQMRFLETSLQALADSGLDDEEKIDVVLAVSSFVRGAAHTSIGVTQGMSRSDLSDVELQAEYQKAYQRVLDPEHFPVTSRLFAGDPAELVEDDDYDFGFEFGLARLLDGVERHIAGKGV